MIKLVNIEKKYDNVPVLRRINLKLDKTGLIFISGKSGSGKSTLLNILGLLDHNFNGFFLFNNQDVSKLSKNKLDDLRRNNISFLFQESYLLPNYNAIDNILLGSPENNKELAKKLMKEFKIEDLDIDYPNELSGGECQRIAFCRAIIGDKPIILCDEPTSNLDSVSSKLIMNKLHELSKEKLVIVVSHEMKYLPLATQHIELNDGYIKINETEKIENKDIYIKESDFKLKFEFYKKNSFFTIFNSKMKLVLSLVIMILTLTIINFSINFIGFDSANILLNTFYEHDISSYSVTKEKYFWIDIKDQQKEVYTHIFNQDELNNIQGLSKNKNYYRYLLNNSYHAKPKMLLELGKNPNKPPLYFYSGYLEIDANYFIDTTSNYYGDLPTNFNQVMISSNLFGSFKQRSYYDESIEKYEDIIGKTIDGYIITGIVESDEEYLKSASQTEDRTTKLENGIGASLFVKKGFHNEYNIMPEINYLDNEYPINTIRYISNEIKDGINYYGKYENLVNNEVNVPINIIESIIRDIKNDELNKYIRDNSDSGSLKESELIIEFIKEHFAMGNKHNIIFQYYTGTGINQISIDIVGFNDSKLAGSTKLVSNKLLNDFQNSLEVNGVSGVDIILTHDRNKDLKLLNHILDTNYFTINSIYNSDLEKVEMFNPIIKYGGIILSFILFIALIFTLYSYLNDSFKSQILNLGVFKSLGFRDDKIYNIFIFQMFFIFLICFILSIPLSFIVNNSFNKYLIERFKVDLIFNSLDINIFFISFFLISILIVFFIFIKVKNIFKKKSPIEQILKRG